MRRLPSASALHRSFACPASEALPHSRSTNEYAQHGTMVHQFIEHARKVGRDEALSDLPDETDPDTRAACEALPLDQLPTGGSLEVPLAWDHMTDEGRLLDGAGRRDYGDARLTEFVGTADYVGVDGDDVVVLDWKTGHRSLGPARESWQLRMLALAAARALDKDAARVAYFFLREDGTVVPAWASFDAFDLAETANALRELAAATPDPDATVEGEHCDYCPAFNSCPAKMKLARAIGSGDAMRDIASIERRIEEMTDDELARAYEAIERYDDVAERVRKALRERAAMQPIDLPKGRRLGTVLWPFTVIKPDVAYATVREMHGEAAAEAAVPRKATLGAIKKLGDETLAEIERRRGVVTGSKPQVRVHRP